MASLTIRLEIDPVTRKKNVVIDYTSDADALPIEHEEEHRRLVGKLIEGGVVSADEIGTVTVRREAAAPTPDAPKQTEQPVAEKAGQKG